jgi:hypothetical protein
MKVLRNGIELSDPDMKALQNDLLNIEDWINGAIAGKIYACKKRLLDEWTPKLLADPKVDTLPGNEAALINVITQHPDYLSRSDREVLLESDRTRPG